MYYNYSNTLEHTLKTTYETIIYLDLFLNRFRRERG